MAHYAFIDENNAVVEVIVGRDEDEVVDGISDWEEYYSSKREGLTAVRTSYNTHGNVYYDPETKEPAEDQSKAFRKNYAGYNYIYNSDLDAFIPPKPFDSWVLDEETCVWEAPVARPEGHYIWDEEAGSWVAAP